MQALPTHPGSTFLMNVSNTVRLAFCGKARKGIYVAGAELSGNSSVIPTKEKSHRVADEKIEKILKYQNVGAFQSLPMVMPSKDILCSAMRKAKMVGPTKGIINLAKRERNRGAKQLDALMKELAVPLRNYVERFPSNQNLHPYEQSLIEFTLGKGKYEEVLQAVDLFRRRITSIGKQQASVCAKSISKREAEQRLSEGFSKMEELFQNNGRAVDNLLNIAKTLRAMPVVDLETPTLCLVGAPNVGKSSLVRILSTGKPEVCNYPFTTRGILMGHITINYERFQVTDTPGLLRRSDGERNNLEKLTLAALSHLPSAVLFVHDLSGDCGTSVSDQFLLYNEMRERFGNRLWMDVVSKADLLSNSSSASYTTENNYKLVGPEGSLHVSIKTNQGINELKQKVHEVLLCELSKTKSMPPNYRDGGDDISEAIGLHSR
ncbi:hypothetical protein SUGI_0058190 [Cryptomeria japonica]|uniref:nucleolar GTP-binding protein 1 n=1 Tax=Cryptomeria japonica TaxID=3369 RepID=UPI002408AC10|nr:nucleolar GTP-binding protein 1 [Cryptomeria japonica]GLJ07098.1 hypothetical protein SUGI_0058190 [Cryptomeria japonica]